MVCLLSALLSLFHSLVIYLCFQSSSKIFAIIARRVTVFKFKHLNFQVYFFIKVVFNKFMVKILYLIDRQNKVRSLF